jgi:DNA replication protein DnaD
MLIFNTEEPMNTSNGWIKLYRCLLDDPIWQCSTNEQKVILITLLLMANHAERKWEWNGRPYICQPGQMITSLNSIREKVGKGISVKKIRTALLRFEKMGFLANQSTKHNRLITICNWEFYQTQALTEGKDAGNPWADEGHPAGHPRASNKNVKNEKNTKNAYLRDSLSEEELELQRADEAFERAKAEFLRRTETEEHRRILYSE